jgi:hypothetical protein
VGGKAGHISEIRAGEAVCSFRDPRKSANLVCGVTERGKGIGRLKKKTVVSVVEAGKVEIHAKRLKRSNLTQRWVF